MHGTCIPLLDLYKNLILSHPVSGSSNEVTGWGRLTSVGSLYAKHVVSTLCHLKRGTIT